MTKEQIQRNAIEIISEQGFEKLTLSTLSRRCNIKKASLYHYFESKEELISSLYANFSSMLRKLGITISFSDTPINIIKATFNHWKQIYKSDEYSPYLSLLFQRRDIDERADELSNSLNLMIQAQTGAVIENLSNRTNSLIKDKELLSELFSSTSIFYLESGIDEEEFLIRFSSLFSH